MMVNGFTFNEHLQENKTMIRIKKAKGERRIAIHAMFERSDREVKFVHEMTQDEMIDTISHLIEFNERARQFAESVVTNLEDAVGKGY